MAYLLDQLLTESARRSPRRLAVSFKGQGLTYEELHEQSSQLAATLRNCGVRNGDRVGIYLHKSLESMVSIFGILKAGGVYVPLDPNSPPRRVAFIIQNCGMRAVITTAQKFEGLRAVTSSDGRPEVVLVDGAGEGEPPWPGSRVLSGETSPLAPAQAAREQNRIDTDLAYILYTSGSTGEPKGVMLTHRHALTFIDWACDAFRITDSDRLSNHAPLHFDLSILDIFCAIKAGATVILVPERLSTFPVRLAEFIHQEGITIWYSVPSALTLLVLHGQLQRFPFERLRTVLFAGEVLPVKYLRTLMQAIPHAEFYNLYGPTETNVCTFYKVPSLAQDRVQPIPIGKACANADVFALNDRGLPIGLGEEGELYVRGSLLTKGYWGDPQRTQQVLVRNPRQPHFEEQVYRTGDIVTVDEDGNYILIGRRDHMVKSRGYRIELGEIETALNSHPRIREAAAVAVPDEQVGNRIKAVVVLDSSDGLTAADLKRFCANRIPHYMVPDTIEFRSILPKTSTGKIDRKLLATARLQQTSGA